MARLTWAPSAAADLEAIHNFIARDSPRHAIDFIQRMMAFIGTIPMQPLLGSVVPEYDLHDLRERAYHGYRIIYRVLSSSFALLGTDMGAKKAARSNGI